MKGLGFLIWQLKNVIPPAAQIAVWKEIGVQWVSIKVRDWTREYNRHAAANSGSLRLEDFILACKEAGISVGTWQFVYTSDLAKQAQLISQDIEQFGLEHLLVDVEQNARVFPYAHWKTYPQYRREACAREYMDNLDLPSGFPVGFCSYRYPELHHQVPYKVFLSHPKMTMVTPQLYWMMSNFPGEQFAESKAQYRKITSLPFNPIGAAYEESGWAPTAGQIGEFNQLSELYCAAWGYYRWGMAKEHEDWLQAMKVEVIPEPEPEPEPEPPPPTHVCEIPKARLVPNVSALRIRTGPSTGYSTVGYVVPTQPTVEVLEKKIVSATTQWFRIGYKQWSAAQYNGNRYLEEL